MGLAIGPSYKALGWFPSVLVSLPPWTNYGQGCNDNDFLLNESTLEHPIELRRQSTNVHLLVFKREKMFIIFHFSYLGFFI